jgi:predicted Rossmann fold nucleotide-binding protein DprA/Smf involved in DNA uptake
VRLAVVGSTNVNQQQELIAKVTISGFVLCYAPEQIISGGAVGIDSLAAEAASRYRIDPLIHLPKNNRWKPEGYEERNTKIAQDCTHLLCIRTQQSTTYGSGWTADLAERLGKTVWRVILP